MKRIVTREDCIDLVHKSMQRGLGFVLSKFNFQGTKRTELAFSQLNYKSADWWIIPKVRQRWNQLISGDPEIDYIKYFVNDVIKNQKEIRLISLGSGLCHKELELARYSNFTKITCVDISEKRMLEAQKRADELGLKNIEFICTDIYEWEVPKDYYDIVFFQASLHHFYNIEQFVQNKIKKSLKINGLLVINEYVGANRLQFPKIQIENINKAIKIIPKEYRRRHVSNLLKKRYFGSGFIRMIISDPSECIDSESILPTIHSNFQTLLEKPFGGNILMSTLKDISHHFVELTPKKNQILEELFLFEDEYLSSNPSDFIFGIYKNIG
ncbi:MAG: class I SAM-dependent methyltransferase [Flavobacteriaceae bacterium]|nr:class I SAM-dependent methyltransferase [Flavobacteriaceae bacterium]MDG2314209.1 class I SAM-dependent methyltransferase [Flavobacteriaceae bacterium]